MSNPNFIQRLGQGLRYAVAGKQLATIVSTWQEGQPVYNNTRFETLVREGWRRNELIYACISKTANTAAQVQAQVVNRDDGEPLDAHPLLDLIHRPNPFMSEFDFWTTVTVYQKLAGVAYFEKVRNGIGLPVQLWPLRPDWVSPIADSKKMIGGYNFTVPGNSPIFIKADDVLRFPVFDPINLYQGWPPAAVAGRVGDVDNAATDYLKLFFERGGTPPGILTSKQRLMPDQAEALRAGWRKRYGGIMGWLDPVVLDQDATYQAIGSSFKDMGFDVLDARNEARICAVLQVPPILVGAKIGLDRSTYSNYGEARRAWWQDDLIPMYANYQDVLDNGLAYEFGEDIKVQWDFSGVWALQEEQDAKWTRALAALQQGAITVNEFRGLVEMEELGAGSDIFLRTLQQVEVPAKMGRKPVLEDDEEMDEEMDAPKSAKAAGNAPDDDARRKQERIVTRAMNGFFDDQLKRAVKDARNGR